MAVKNEVYPILIKVKPNAATGIDESHITFDLDTCSINIYNDRGGILTEASDHSKLFKDDTNHLIGYAWDTSDDRFNIQDHYTFEFLVSINYETGTGLGADPDNPSLDRYQVQNLRLQYTTTKLLESNNRI